MGGKQTCNQYKTGNTHKHSLNSNYEAIKRNNEINGHLLHCFPTIVLLVWPTICMQTHLVAEVKKHFVKDWFPGKS